jgi:predicted DNA binding CopG/RHH family protein
MSEGRSKNKRLIPIPEALLRGLMEASSNEGKPLNRYIEEALQQAIKVFETGQNLKGMVHYFEILQSQKASGAIFTPLTVFDFMTSKVYITDKEKLLDVWFESGKWYGKYLTEKFEDPVQALADLLQAARWDLNEVNVKEIDGKINLRCTSTALTKEGTELLLKFISGALDGMKCKILKSEFMKGLILVEFTLCT